MPEISRAKEKIKKTAPEFTWQDYFKKSFIESLAREGVLEKEKERLLKETETAYGEIKKKTADLIEEIKKMPPMPSKESLPPFPNIPEKVDTFKNLTSHAKLLLSITMIALTVKGVKEGVPELGLVSFSSAIGALKKMDEEEFKRRMDEYMLSLQRLKLETERVVWDYEQKQKQWELTKLKPLELELIQDRQNYEILKSQLSMIDKALSDAGKLRNDIAKAWFESEKEERKYMLDVYKATLQARRVKVEEEVKRALTPLERRKKEAEAKKLEWIVEKLGDPNLSDEQKMGLLRGAGVLMLSPEDVEMMKKMKERK